MNRKNVWRIYSVGIFEFLLFVIAPNNLLAATLVLSPSSTSVSVGGTFTVNIVLNTAGLPIYGVDIYSLHFNPAVLQVVDADASMAGMQITAGTLMGSNQYNTVNNSTGVIQFSQTPSTGGVNFNGTGTLATITFRGITAGTSNVTFDFTAGSTIDTNVADLYSDLLSGVTNGLYTVTAVADVTPPVISSISSAAITQSGANIIWTTNENSDSQVEYGLTAAYGNSSNINATLLTAHNITLSSLSAATLYHYRAKSKDVAGNLAVSADQTFTTASPAAPTISGIAASAITQTSVTIGWNTSSVTNGQVKYGTTVAYGAQSAIADNIIKTLSHGIPIAGLSPGVLYHYQVVSVDAFGASVYSTDQTFTTTFTPDTTAPIATISSPPAGSTLSGTVTVSATAVDQTVVGQVNSGIFATNLLIDGSQFATSPSAVVSTSLDTTTLTNASHSIIATTRDNAGNTASSSAISITIFNLSTATRYPRKLQLSSLEGLAVVPLATNVNSMVISPANQSTLSTQSISPDASSLYTVNFQTSFPQVVSIRVAVPLYLTRLLSNIDTTVNTATPILVPKLLAGDFNSDNTINALDYSVLNSHWLQNYLISDINLDGLVNSLDFAVLQNNWNMTGE